MIEILYHWKGFLYYQARQASRKNEFAAAVLDPEHKTFVVHIASLSSPSNDQENNVYLFCRAQIATLVANKATTFIPTEYSNFKDVFSLKLALKFHKYTWINDHAIELIDER